ncbi:4-hydroxy-tetrahydrodipicolinate reductase, partial [Gammaproteobacteria bacterium]|nr:4-hydroxy-tetrahydrodipicolinate reductase [Gammaproteobacteria bacterium]
FDVLIEETHHIHKVDAPSGTALKLGEAVAAARGQDFKEVAEFEPAGAAGKSMPGAIRIRAERRGEVPGDHAVTMSSAAETLMLSHSVTTRQVFADGALRAARWVVSQPPGLYSMRDVMF